MALFTTSHIKGVVDGLGGTVERAVRRFIRSGKGIALTPLTFFSKSQRQKFQITCEVHFNGNHLGE